MFKHKLIKKISKTILIPLLITSIWFCGMTMAQSTTFSERLNEIWLDVSTFSNKKSISRYEVARLLNAANCEDCVQAPIWMQQTYDQTFWDGFRAIDGKDFNDINYWAAVWNKKSYYYCVAYVWDHGYMAGYPSTSTKCQWNFCGQDSITLAETYQTILNIIQPQIRSKYQINWAKVKSRLRWLRKNTIQMGVLNQTDINAINNADSKTVVAQTNEEFQAWLKYCMYNVSDCWFQPFWVVWTWYWPVSELNILYKEWIISRDDALKVSVSTSMNWADAVRIFWAVFDRFTSCSFNVDYDCDWISNGQDNCPYTYNVNQFDLDGDGIWNVCDDDIDGDGIQNPIWIVDDNDRIVISLRNTKLDQMPLWDDYWFWFFINVEAIASWFPTAVIFMPITDWDIKSIERNFWDGESLISETGKKITHVFTESWSFNVSAIATDKWWKQSFAMTKIFIWSPQSENHMLNISPMFAFKNGAIEYTFTPIYSGDINTIERNINGTGNKSLKVSEKFAATIDVNWIYVIEARWYKNWQLKSIAAITIRQNRSPLFSNMVVRKWNLWEKTYVDSNIVWFTKNDISSLAIDWWWKLDISEGFVHEYMYDMWWKKMIQQTVTLQDGTKLLNVATVTIQNSSLSQSYALNIIWNKLSYNQNDRLQLWLNIYPKTQALSLISNYQSLNRYILFSPDLSQVSLNFVSSVAGKNMLINTVDVNQCVSLINQWTVQIKPVDICEQALKWWTLSQYKCDLDGDGIPDVCDDDIDGDGQKNLLWIITKENRDCSVSSNNVNLDILRKQLWVCSLDSCPFNNLEVSDLNNNWIWDVCEKDILELLWSSYNEDRTVVVDGDIDKDGVPDSQDKCINIPGNSYDGCPIYKDQYCQTNSLCWNGALDEWETCRNCPYDVWPCCGNWIFDSWESCSTCALDVWNCDSCWNGKIDEWETCKTCPEDVWSCTAFCWNWNIEDAETCQNCPEDVGQCSDSCWNGKIDEWETCENCPQDLWNCIDDWDDNKCWNGKIDEWETCENCPKDLKDICVDDGNDDKCWNWIQDIWEDCGNCPRDVADCNKCGNGIIDEWETCKNCPEDVGWCVETNACNSCPCAYADFLNSFTRWDSIRAKLWDKSLSVFYRYSNVVAIENFLNM